MMVTYFSANLEAWLALARTRICRGVQFQILVSPLCSAELKYVLGKPVSQNNEKVQPLISVHMLSNKYKRPFDTQREFIMMAESILYLKIPKSPLLLLYVL